MFMRSIALALGIFLVVSLAHAKTPDELNQTLETNLSKGINRALTSYNLRTERLLKSQQKKRRNQVAFCINSKADYDFDGDVDLIDQNFFDFCFSSSGAGLGCKAADLSRDGIVNLADLILFASEKDKSGDITRSDLCLVVPTATPVPVTDAN